MNEVRTCGKCSYYSRALLRCRLGKVNPRTRKGTLEVMRLFGNVCAYSKWKQQVVDELLNLNQKEG